MVDNDVLEKTMSILVHKLDDRDRIIDLELKNLSKSIKLDIVQYIKEAHESLEGKIEKKISKAIESQQSKISWGIEVGRFVLLFITFILSIKVVK